MLGVYEFKTFSNILKLAWWQNKLKPLLLSFHFLLLFFSLSLSIFFDKLPYILERAKEIQNLAFVAFLIEN